MQAVMYVLTVLLAVGPNVSGTIGSNWTFHFTYMYYLLWTATILSYLFTDLFYSIY